MIEDLKQVRDALVDIRNCYRTHSTISSGVWECKIKPSLATLDRIIADHIPDDSKMVVPDGYKLVPIEPTPTQPENVELKAKLDKAKGALWFYGQEENYVYDQIKNRDNPDWEDEQIIPTLEDNGQRARTTLEELGE